MNRRPYRQQIVDSILEVDDGFMCLACHKVHRQKAHAKEHYLLIHAEEGYEFVCPMCEGLRDERVYRNRKCLYRHMRDKHNVSYKVKDMDPFMRPKEQPYID